MRDNHLLRRGSILLECTIAVVLTAMLFVAVAQVLVLVNRQRQSAQWRSMALEEAANMLEQIMLLPDGQLTDQHLAQLELAVTTRAILPDPQLRIDVSRQPGPPALRQLRVSIDWRNHAGQRSAPVRLVAWKHSKEAGS